MTDEMTMADAKLHVADQDRKRALKAIEGERQKVDRAAATAKKARARFEKTVAAAITSRPDKVDWYNHPGPLDPAQVRAAGKLSPDQVHRLMERQRADAKPKKKGRR